MRAVAHVIPYGSLNFGGPVVAMATMVEGLAALGAPVSVHTVRMRGEPAPVSLVDEVRLQVHCDGDWGPLRHSAGLWRSLLQEPCAVLHSHGIWTDVHRCVAAVARRRGIPHVIGLCGMLDRAALQRSRWKKRWVGSWFQYAALRNAQCLLANCEAEVDDIRAFGLRNPVALVPNPVRGPRQSPERLHGADHLPPLFSADKKTVLFLGRVHPVKGLERLVGAWSRLHGFHRDWQLVIAGPDEGGYRATIESHIRQSGCGASVSLIGALDEAQKWSALEAAELFVMPSDFENFGLAIAEALIARTPVITTRRTPWQALATAGAGWWVEPSVDAIADALESAMRLDRAARAEMGLRGHSLAGSFSPDRVASQLTNLYRWLQNQAEIPPFVHSY
jgi:glycosyltransferase involved in cell wall biosynthesis